jgi:hypothetical protein
MTSNNQSGPQDESPQGKKLFYRQPELLNHQVHGSLGLIRPERPFEFARHARALPVTLPEFQSAQKSYPIVFSDMDNPLPVAVVGMADDFNLYVDDAGNWERGTYIPAYVRCYPFALAARSDDQFAVVIDRAAESISENTAQPFFAGDQVTQETQKLIDFCGQYDAESKATAHFGQRLKELGLLAGQQVSSKNASGEDEAIARYVAVDPAKLNGIDGDVVKELFSNGFRAAIFAHLFSLENWQQVLDRHARLTSNGSPRAA